MWCRPSTSRTGRSERHLDTAWVPVRAGCVAFRHVCSQQRLHCLGSQTRPCNPTARRNVWLTSEQHLDLNFNPASLLSIGDAMAFMRDAQGECCRLAWGSAVGRVGERVAVVLLAAPHRWNNTFASTVMQNCRVLFPGSAGRRRAAPRNRHRHRQPPPAALRGGRASGRTAHQGALDSR